MSKDTDDVFALERRFWTDTNDPGLFREVMADDGIAVIEPMGVIEKAKAVEYSAQGKPFRDVELTDLVVRQPTPDCIVLAYHGQGRHEGEEKPYRGSICSVYVRREGRWQSVLTAHQPWAPKAR